MACQEYSKRNAAKLERRWLAIMRQSKAEQLQASVSLLADDSWHALQRKGELVEASPPPVLAPTAGRAPYPCAGRLYWERGLIGDRNGHR